MISKKFKGVIMGLIATTILTSASFSYNHDTYAMLLEELGLFKGSDDGYELEREPNRCEIAVMLIRLIGKEDEVLSGSYTHPFTDVPKWADKYIGYMYENNLTKGISKTEFGSSNLVDARDYGTFLLRALGYDDTKGDFSWNSALEACVNKNIITNYDAKNLSTKKFIRDDMVYMSFNTLMVPVANNTLKLYEKLDQSGVLPEDSASFLDQSSARNAIIDETASVIPEVGAVNYTFTEDLYGLNMKFCTDNEENLTANAIAEMINDEWRTFVTILDLSTNNGMLSGNLNFSSSFGFNDTQNLKKFEYNDFEERHDFLIEFGLGTDKMVDSYGKVVNLEDIKTIKGLKIISYVETNVLEFENSFVNKLKKITISVPGKIIYSSENLEVINDHTVKISENEDYKIHHIIFEPNTSK